MDRKGHARRDEIELLLLCAQAKIGSERSDTIRALAGQEIDWDSLLNLARQNAVTPLLYRGLEAACSEAIPPAVWDRLHQIFRSNAQRNLAMASELIQITEDLEKAGIPTLSFKGPLLAAAVYGDLSLREFADLDFLIRKNDLSETSDLLISRGYRCKEAERPGPLKNGSLFGCQHQFVREEDGILVEMHWFLVPGYFSVQFDDEGLWQRARRWPLGGVEIQSFCPEDLLLFLCVHGCKHLWEKLGWLADIAKVIHVHDTMDWEWLLNQARTLRAQRMLFLGLFLAHELLKAELPPEVLQKVRGEDEVRVLAGEIEARLFKGICGPFKVVERIFFYWRMRESFPDRLRNTFRHILMVMTPTAREWDPLPLPDWLFPLYYLVRPIRLALKYTLGVWE